VVTLDARLSTYAVIVTDVSRFSPDVVTWFTAKRVSARAALLIETRVSGAGETASARFAISSASARVTIPAGVSSDFSAEYELTPSSPC
jgi:hypothetical protein